MRLLAILFGIEILFIDYHTQTYKYWFNNKLY
ncbi:Uncharacterised protein [Elizabethkingia anophelis]|uniref:Uncharacterized protein n=1 Tax=Elizabethkingia anophelis TaxID=1117645 RepID=A0A7Z7LU53_9FLAO|nr:Uncharacterised protein [Elizabethkingia anophelis]